VRGVAWSERVKIGKREVGGDAPVFIIAELSANHGQRKDIALRSIEAAADAGADAIKLQTYTPDTLTLNSSAPPFVVKSKNEWAGRTLHDLYAEAMTPWEWHAELIAHARSRGLECFSTPFDATAVAFLETLGVPCHKVASFELNDLALVETIARTGKPMILSTGMASLADIEAALATCREAGNDNLALLRCVSCYPAKPESMDLRSYDMLRHLDVVLGLSDHTRDNTVAIASVALGAKVIEKHFILDRTVGGPDAFFSLEPGELKALVRDVRATTAALGRPRFGPSEDEVASTAFRRSLFVSAPVKRGETFTASNVRSVRPSYGLDPKLIGAVLGRTATRDIDAATPLAWDMVGPPREVPALTLRRATKQDSAALLAWRNDPHTRAMSITNDEVTVNEHDAWLARSLEASNRWLFVAETAGRPVGVVRLDAHGPASIEVSLTVAPGERGKGYAVAMLRAAEAEARAHGAGHLVAVLKPDNTASRRAFEAAGYRGFVDHEERGVKLVRCERRIAPYKQAGDRA
jgi:pseudaminic acid synthase